MWCSVASFGWYSRRVVEGDFWRRVSVCVRGAAFGRVEVLGTWLLDGGVWGIVCLIFGFMLVLGVRSCGGAFSSDRRSGLGGGLLVLDGVGGNVGADLGWLGVFRGFLEAFV